MPDEEDGLRARDSIQESPLGQAKSLLRRLNVRAAKGLGQHFLIDRSVLGTIVSAAELEPADTVVEVGPGLGILTDELVREAGNVVAVEVDPKLASALASNFAKVPQVTV